MKNFENELLNYEITDIQRQTDNENLINERKHETLFKIFNIRNVFERNDYLNFVNHNYTKNMNNIIKKEFSENSTIYKVYSELKDNFLKSRIKLTSNLKTKSSRKMTTKEMKEYEELLKLC